MNQHKKGLLAIGCVFVLFLSALLISTDAIVALAGLTITRSPLVPNDAIFRTHSAVEYWFDYVNVSGDITGRVSTLGWAYMPTTVENPDKRIDLYFVSDQDVYTVPTKLSERVTLSGEGIMGKNHMFDGEFSFLQMKDGIYQLYLYCYENQVANGAIATSRYYEKSGRNFTQVTAPETTILAQMVPLPIETAAMEEPFYHSIDVCKLEEGNIFFQGWGAIMETDSRDTKLYLVLQSADKTITTYDTVQYDSNYLRDVFESDLYDHAYFYSNIPLTDLSPGRYHFALAMSGADGQLWLCPWAHAFQISEDGAFTYFSEMENTSFFDLTDTVADFSDNPDLYHSIDLCAREQGDVLIKGWALEVGTPSDDASVLIGLTNEVGDTVIYSTEPYSNPYLREVMDSDIYDNAFFECRIPASDLTSGAYTISVLVRGQQNGRSTVTHTFVLGQDGTVEYTP